MTQVTCKKCKHEWNYKGKSEYYISCPHCRKNINIQKIIQEDKT